MRRRGSLGSGYLCRRRGDSVSNGTAENCLFIGGMCVSCDPERDVENEELRYLNDSEVNDEDLTVYKRFGVG